MVEIARRLVQKVPLAMKPELERLRDAVGAKLSGAPSKRSVAGSNPVGRAL
jgi:hypothetical protein